MADIPNEMMGLVLKGDGYANTSEGPMLDSLEPWLSYQSLAVPTPKDGELLIKVIEGGVNPSDLHFIKGEYGIARVKGRPAGFEGCGIVIKSGTGGDHLIGKRVGFIATSSGAWADYAISDLKNCVPVSDGVSDDDAAALFVNPLTAIAMIEEIKASGAKSFILSAASSQLCKLIIGLAKDEGLAAIGLVRRDEQMSHLKNLGANEVLNIRADSFNDEMKQVIKTLQPTIFLDALADQLSSEIFAQMPKKAQWVIYGKLSQELPSLTQPGQFIFMDKLVKGFWLTKWLGEQSPDQIVAAGVKVQTQFASKAWKTDIAAHISLKDAHAQLPNYTTMPNSGKIMLIANQE